MLRTFCKKISNVRCMQMADALLDRLEEEWDVVQHNDNRTVAEEGDPQSGAEASATSRSRVTTIGRVLPEVSLFEQAHRDHCPRTHVHRPPNKG